MGWIPDCRRALLFAAALCMAAPGLADGARHTFWAVRGQYNTVWLFGSVHVLKAGDRDLPAVALQAYADAGALVMELDLSDAGAQGTDGGSVDGELLPEGQTLGAALGPAAYATLQAHLQPLGLDAGQFSRMQPWFVAITVEQLELARLGFDAGSGVEMQFTRRAQADHKPVIALETVAEQLRIFSHLSPDEQRRFLRYCLEDSADSGREMDAIVAAWRGGDTVQLERLLGEGFADFPDLYRLLSTERNRRWLPRIESMLHDRRDYLVTVSYTHLTLPTIYSV